MFSTARKLSVFSFILCMINAVFTALLLLMVSKLPFSEAFVKMCYLVSGTVVLLLLTVITRSICSDLELESDARTRQLHDQAEKIKKLEEKIKYLENNP